VRHAPRNAFGGPPISLPAANRKVRVRLFLVAAWIAVVVVIGTSQYTTVRRRAAEEHAVQVADRKRRDAQDAYEVAYLRSKPLEGIARSGNVERFRIEIARLYPAVPPEAATWVLYAAANSGQTGVIRFWFSKPWPRRFHGEPLAPYLLSWTAASDRSETARFLLSLMTRDEIRATGGRTLVAACDSHRKGTPKLAILLAQSGADVNCRWTNRRLADPHFEGWTPLMFAASNGWTELVPILLEHHADASLRAADGRTAMDIARGERHSDIVQILLRAPALNTTRHRI